MSTAPTPTPITFDSEPQVLKSAPANPASPLTPLTPTPSPQTPRHIGSIFRRAGLVGRVVTFGLIALGILLGGGAFILFGSHGKHVALQKLSPGEVKQLQANQFLKNVDDYLISGDFAVDGATVLQGKATLQKDISVNGNADVGGDITAANFKGQSLTVSGSGTFGGNLTAANFNGSVVNVTGTTTLNGTVTAGTLTANTIITTGSGVFAGPVTASQFFGDGSNLTGVLTSCPQCVHLQTGSLTLQTGNTAITGTVTAGNVSVTNNNQPVLTTDALNQSVTVGNLLPSQIGVVTQGVIKGAVAVGVAADDGEPALKAPMVSDGHGGLYITFNSGGDGGGQTPNVSLEHCIDAACKNTTIQTVYATDQSQGDGSREVNALSSVALGPDGLPRITLVDALNDSQPYDGDIHYLRCTNVDCSQKVDTTIDSHVQNAGVNIPLVIGSDGFARMLETYNEQTLKLIRCTDQDCTSPVVTDVINDPTDSNNCNGDPTCGINGDLSKPSMILGTDGLPRLAYERGTYDPNIMNETEDQDIQYLRCLDQDCTTFNQNTLININNSTMGWNNNPEDEMGMTIKMVNGPDGYTRTVFQDTTQDGNGSALNDILLVRCTDADCSAPQTTRLVKDNGVDPAPELVIGPDGLPRLSFMEEDMDHAVTSNNDEPEVAHVHYVTCKDVSCNSRSDQVLVDDVKGPSTSLILSADGRPQIIYGDANTNVLELISFGTPNGQDATSGTTIGTSAAPFGQITTTQLNIQATNTSALTIQDQAGNTVMNVDSKNLSVKVNASEDIGGTTTPLGGVYQVNQITFDPATLDSGATEIATDWDTPNVVNLPFSFNFYDKTYSSIYVSRNGYFSFLPNQPTSDAQTLPSLDGAKGYVAPFMTELTPTGPFNDCDGSSVKYQVFGSAPNRVLVLQYDQVNRPWCNTNNTVTTQVKLFEGTNNIEIHTTNASAAGQVTQGIESPSGVVANYVSGRSNTNFSLSNDAVQFAYTAPQPQKLAVGDLGVQGDIFTNGVLHFGDGTTLASASGFGADSASLSANQTFTGSNTFVNQTVFSNGIQFGDGSTLTTAGGLQSSSSSGNFTVGAGLTVGKPLYGESTAYIPSSTTFAPSTLDGNATTQSLSGYFAQTGAINLPFTFYFYGQPHSSVYLSKQGGITFSGQSQDCSNLNNLSGITGYIAGFDVCSWNPDTATVSYETLGSTGNRVFVADFTDPVGWNTSNGHTAHFQIKLFEGSNNIEVHDIDANSQGDSVAEGLRSDDGMVTDFLGNHGGYSSLNLQNVATLFRYTNNVGALPAGTGDIGASGNLTITKDINVANGLITSTYNSGQINLSANISVGLKTPSNNYYGGSNTQGGTFAYGTGDQYEYRVSALNVTGESAAGQSVTFTTNDFTPIHWWNVSAPTLQPDPNPGLLDGTYTYKVSAVTAHGETSGSYTSTEITVSGQQVDVSLPIGQTGVIARKIYRTVAGGADGTQQLVATINDNTTTQYVDNVPDSSLGAQYPGSDTAYTDTNAPYIYVNSVPGATSYRVYRRINGGAWSYQIVKTAGYFQDLGDAGQPGTPPGTSSTSLDVSGDIKINGVTVCSQTSGCSGTLQGTYANTSGQAVIKEDSSRGGLILQDADSSINGSLFNVASSNPSGVGSSLFNVQSSGGVSVGTLLSGEAAAYNVASTTYAPATLTGAATALSLGDDQMSSSIGLPFNFQFYGQTYSSLYVSSNGFVTFSKPINSSCASLGNGYGSTNADNNYIGGDCLDLFPPGGGTLKYETQGTSPNRVFIIDYANIPTCCNSANPKYSFQIKLFEGSNNIEFHNTAIPTWLYQGLQSASGRNGIYYPSWPPGYGGGVTNQAVVYTPTGSVSVVQPTSGSLTIQDKLTSAGDVSLSSGVITTSSASSLVGLAANTQVGMIAPTWTGLTSQNTGGTYAYEANGATTRSYKVTALNSGGETIATPAVQMVSSGFQALYPYYSVSPSVSQIAGNLNGSYSYKITYVTSHGETNPYYTSNTVNPVNQQVTLSFPTQPGATARKIYRTPANGVDGSQLLLTTINDDTTTTYTDNTPDSSLGATFPTTNTAFTDTNEIQYWFQPVNGATSYRIYRQVNSGAWQYTVVHNTTYYDTGSSTWTNGDAPSSNTSGHLGVGVNSTNANLQVAGTTILGGVNSGAALQVQNLTGANVLSVDTQGNNTFISGTLNIQGIQPASSSGDGTLSQLGLQVVGAAGGNTTGSSGQTAGNGAGISLTAGNGGTAPSGSVNGSGGDIILQAGLSGTGSGQAGSAGTIKLQVSGGKVGVGISTPDGKFDVSTGNASTAGVVIHGVAGQTSDLLQAKDSSSNVLAKIASDGSITVQNATVQGTLTVTGNATFSGNVITFSNNVRGYNVAVTTAATTQAVTFGTAYPDANYAVFCSPSYNSTCWVTGKSTTGFTLNFGTAAPANAKVDWLVAH